MKPTFGGPGFFTQGLVVCRLFLLLFFLFWLWGRQKRQSWLLTGGASFDLVMPDGKHGAEGTFVLAGPEGRSSNWQTPVAESPTGEDHVATD